MPKKNSIYIGFTNINTDGYKYKIIDILGDDRYIVEFEDSKYRTIKRSKEVKNGKIKDYYKPSVLNIGILGGELKKEDKEIHEIWRHMLLRCYDPYELNKHPTYIDCTVCKEWHNFQNFAKWYKENYYEVKDEIMHLDKDILLKGNKIYNPDTCIFVPLRINELFTKSNKARGKYPIGVSWKKKNKKFQVQCSIFKDNKKTMKYLGLYNTVEEAFIVYKAFKENYIKQVADEYKKYIPTKLYEAMYKYEVELDD